VATHVHLCQTLFRGAAEGLDLYRWLQHAVWPLEAALEPETIGVAAEAGILQLLAGGVTTLLDMGTTRHTASVLETAERLGIRGLFGPAWMDRGPDPSAALWRAPEEFAAEIDALGARFHGADDGRLRIALCPRFIPSVTNPVWRELAARPEWRELAIHTHGAETREEVEEVRRLTGGTPAAWYASLPGAAGRIKMAHGVWLDDADRRALRGSGTAVLHCPGSNFKLGSGICDVAALERADVPVGLGPDGAACNNRLDPWQEMRLAAYARSLLHGPGSVDAGAILRQATRGGAEAIGLGGETGALLPGMRADLVVCDPGLDPALWDAAGGTESPEAALVFAGSPAVVRETIVQGRTVWRRGDGDRETAARVRSARRRLFERAGLAPSGPEETPDHAAGGAAQGGSTRP